ncbi:MAG: putative Fe-S cluster assembly protein SufT [Deltaproteobacteria bacterium]|nr:putative Fe-S cluster assembly protein SufT [Deltaproteobacteria bacterium]
MNDAIELARELSVIQIPDGTPLVVPAGTRGYVMQLLGGNFTVRLETGHLVRVNGADAEAIGRTPPAGPTSAVGGDDLESQVWAQLRTCFDPEIPVNIVDLGLIYGLEVSDDEARGGKIVSVTMTLTAPGCGMGQVLKDDVESKVRGLPGVVEARVELTFDPPWGPDKMTEEAQLELGFY